MPAFSTAGQGALMWYFYPLAHGGVGAHAGRWRPASACAGLYVSSSSHTYACAGEDPVNDDEASPYRFRPEAGQDVDQVLQVRRHAIDPLDLMMLLDMCEEQS